MAASWWRLIQSLTREVTPLGTVSPVQDDGKFIFSKGKLSLADQSTFLAQLIDAENVKKADWEDIKDILADVVSEAKRQNMSLPEYVMKALGNYVGARLPAANEDNSQE